MCLLCSSSCSVQAYILEIKKDTLEHIVNVIINNNVNKQHENSMIILVAEKIN